MPQDQGGIALYDRMTSNKLSFRRQVMVIDSVKQFPKFAE